MTARLLIRCDGTPAERPGMALARCRAFIVLPAVPAEVAGRLNTAGWRRLDPHARDLCPACSRAAS